MKRTILGMAIANRLQAEAGEVAEVAGLNPAVATAAEVALAAPTAEVVPQSPIPNTVFSKENFFFKKDKKLGTKRDTVTLLVPVPTEEAILQMLQDEKQKALLVAAMKDMVMGAVREQVSNDNNPVNKQEELDLTKCTLEYIASLPASERRGGGISKETWEDFSTDYISVMQAATGKSAEQVGNAAKLFVGRLQGCKTNKPVLGFLRDQLDLWFSKTTEAEDFAAVYEFLSGKVKAFLEADEASLLANL